MIKLIEKESANKKVVNDFLRSTECVNDVRNVLIAIYNDYIKENYDDFTEYANSHLSRNPCEISWQATGKKHLSPSEFDGVQGRYKEYIKRAFANSRNISVHTDEKYSYIVFGDDVILKTSVCINGGCPLFYFHLEKRQIEKVDGIAYIDCVEVLWCESIDGIQIEEGKYTVSDFKKQIKRVDKLISNYLKDDDGIGYLKCKYRIHFTVEGEDGTSAKYTVDNRIDLGDFIYEGKDSDVYYFDYYINTEYFNYHVFEYNITEINLREQY